MANLDQHEKADEFQNHNKLTCSSSSTTDDQKGDSFSSSDSDASLKKDPVLDDTITVLDINEPLMIINKEQGNNMQQSTSDEDVLKCDNHSQVKVLFRKENETA